MSWHLFDERGVRAQRLTVYNQLSFEVVEGWGKHRMPEALGATQVLGFMPERSWRPTFFAAKMARGYRVFELDVGEHQYVDQRQLAEMWQPATQIAFGRAPPASEKRIATLAGVEMYLRAIA